MLNSAASRSRRCAATVSRSGARRGRGTVPADAASSNRTVSDNGDSAKRERASPSAPSWILIIFDPVRIRGRGRRHRVFWVSGAVYTTRRRTREVAMTSRRALGGLAAAVALTAAAGGAAAQGQAHAAQGPAPSGTLTGALNGAPHVADGPARWNGTPGLWDHAHDPPGAAPQG